MKAAEGRTNQVNDKKLVPSGNGRVSYRIVITGKVQGVSFRDFMRQRAMRHQVKGWVKNRRDGSVEALMQGREDRVLEMIRWAEFGPPGASVRRVTYERVERYPPQAGFAVIS